MAAFPGREDESRPWKLEEWTHERPPLTGVELFTVKVVRRLPEKDAKLHGDEFSQWYPNYAIPHIPIRNVND